MIFDFHPVLRSLHIFLGAAGFLLGAAAILLPKFSAKSHWHRWIGRTYAVSMLGMALISIPLSIWNNSILLLVIGLFTLAWVAGGWLILRRLRAQLGGKRIPPSSRLRLHVSFMGSSYIAAWTAFLVNVEPFGAGPVWTVVYATAPSIIGTFLITRTIARLSNPARIKAARMGSQS